jgi:uncharacterized protein YydD (DUF2326 family)
VSTTDNDDWKLAVLANEAVGREVKALNDRITANRKKWQQDRIAEMKTELHAYETRPSRHDD